MKKIEIVREIATIVSESQLTSTEIYHIVKGLGLSELHASNLRAYAVTDENVLSNGNKKDILLTVLKAIQSIEQSKETSVQQPKMKEHAKSLIESSYTIEINGIESYINEKWLIDVSERCNYNHDEFKEIILSVYNELYSNVSIDPQEVDVTEERQEITTPNKPIKAWIRCIETNSEYILNFKNIQELHNYIYFNYKSKLVYFKE